VTICTFKSWISILSVLLPFDNKSSELYPADPHFTSVTGDAGRQIVKDVHRFRYGKTSAA
jgi:hypothetical protein